MGTLCAPLSGGKRIVQSCSFSHRMRYWARPGVLFAQSKNSQALWRANWISTCYELPLTDGKLLSCLRWARNPKNIMFKVKVLVLLVYWYRCEALNSVFIVGKQTLLHTCSGGVAILRHNWSADERCWQQIF